MSLKLLFFLLGAAGVVGMIIGYIFRWLFVLAQKGSIELEVKQLLINAREEATRITEEAERHNREAAAAAEAEIKEKEEKLARAEDRLFAREQSVDKRQQELDAELTALKTRIEEVKQIRERADALLAERADALTKVAGLSKEDARKALLEEIERENSEDILVRIQKLERDGMETLERKAREILVTSIHRLASSVTSDTMATALTIPNDDIKGKVIGKEGRNIKAFERATGVDVIIDDTPGSIVISSFDPIRRAVARVALENLIVDGRIQPAKIEEVVEKARQEVNKVVKEKGE
ncbi:MAG TPA: Rnase Y domain-containing protein, partial [Candidatus Paceibacterota bacterium]